MSQRGIIPPCSVFQAPPLPAMHAHCPVKNGWKPLGLTCWVGFVIGKRGIEAMRLEVDLVYYVESKGAADLVPDAVVGVVRAAHGIETGLRCGYTKWREP